LGIFKKVKTWTHLPEKLLNKNKGTQAARDVPQLIDGDKKIEILNVDNYLTISC